MGIGRTNRSTVVAVVCVLLAGLLPAARPLVAAAQPDPLQPYRIGVDRGDPGDIWSTDSRGGDQRAVTRDGEPDETDPAYSPDGTRIAWTEFGGGEDPPRVRVANADGSAARYLGERRGLSQPTWSPDGTRIAVTDRDSISVLRASDGALLSTVPRPDHLRGQDSQPAWSPDGRTIAFSRTSQGQDTPLVTPRSVGASTSEGGSFSTSATLRTPAVPRLPEIVFLVDTTGSMGDALAVFKAEIPKVMDEILVRDPGARFGVASYKDTPDQGRRYELLLALTSPAEVKALLADPEQLKAEGGGDSAPEDWFNGLHRIARDLDLENQGRHRLFDTPGASRIVVLAGDASSKQTGDPCESDLDPPVCEWYWSLDEIKFDLAGGYPPTGQPRGIKLVAVPILGSGDGLDRQLQATELVRHTGGSMVTEGARPTEIANAIDRGIKSIPVTVTPVAHCDYGVSITFTPAEATVNGDTDVTFQETVRLDPQTGPGTRAVGDHRGCTVQFRFDGEDPTRPHEQTIRITEAAAGLPTVVVNGAAAPSPQGLPVAVTFSATATSVAGAPLTPSCDATSGALFPVGVTSVTCTADDGGRIGRAASIVAVFVPEDVAYQDIWLVDVTGPLVQTDLSVRFAGVCARGDENPDWSPDGRRLVYQHGNGLCTADVDGANTAVLVPDGSGARQPAWSPDGALIAFSAPSGEEGPRRIYAVPPSGGTPVELVSFGAQSARAPAFQRLPDLVVTGAVAPARIPFSGTTTARFRVSNTGFAPTDATVALAVPAGLRVDELVPTAGTCDALARTCALGRLAPGTGVEIRLTVTGVTAGAQVVRADAGPDAGPDVNPADNRAEVTITVDEEVTPPPTPGSLSMAVAVLPAESYVGGADVVLVFKLRNGSGTPMTGVRVVTSLPPPLVPPTAASPGCAADGTSCDIGVLQPLQVAEVRISLPAKAAVDTSAGGSALGTGPDADAADNTAVGKVLVRRPELAVEPLVGPTGFVPRVTGSGLPPGATVALAWSQGISATPGTMTVRDDGTVDTGFLVFENDLVGTRELVATPVTGPGFAAVRSNPFLVVQRTLQPPDFATRG
ncbi:DUF11 domain-containing protein [Actinosynnema sp. NPDC047251]|uniref:VWFA domain-containing protein n=1 Tax=Saccharothrix espanaensis (strain ATCC 51144 / DSM 44229 / JCM 9112 / NBRC 15066 / NRRL 15764) TaxID=1179773 RepID=K0K895_SACES|nr:DUF11 domain-containing protein [Saccharothrix espanaensis]CCH33752.1 hypothetical protein BN6_65100 [Saccharothrix espanaensis DSM 44229]